MSAEEEKSVKDRVLIDYADVKKALAVLKEEAHQIGEQLSGIAGTLKSGSDIPNLALECYQKLLNKDIYEVIAHLQADIPRAEMEMARLSDKMREIGYAYML